MEFTVSFKSAVWRMGQCDCLVLSLLGGHDGSSYLNSVERYDPKTNQWSGAVAPTTSCRTSVGVGVLDGHMYAVGGQDGVCCLDIVERWVIPQPFSLPLPLPPLSLPLSSLEVYFTLQ